MRNCCSLLRLVLLSSVAVVVLGCVTGCESGMPGLEGPSGTDGADGADGQLRIYGDGSAGALTIAAGTPVDLSTAVPDFNFQFTDFTVEAGALLETPNGAVIRCTGTFTNNGFVKVKPHALSRGGGYFGGAYAPPAIGISGGQAGSGELGDNSDFRTGGIPALGLLVDEARNVLMPGVWGGGGGAGGIGGPGGNGGGTIVILAQGGFTNGAGATLQADGGDGSSGGGGGGGGVIIIASPAAIVNNTNGVFSAFGGDGGASGTFDGAGGGGGGGIVHLISPAITAGTIIVGGGLAGVAGGAASVTSPDRSGGGGGGAGGGDGGNGGGVSAGGTPNAPIAGLDGHKIESEFDPTSLF